MKIVGFICFFLFTTSLIAQENIQLVNDQLFVTNNAIVYDEGGEFGDFQNSFMISTIKAPYGYIELIFNEIKIPSGAIFKIYSGVDTSLLIGVYDGYFKPFNLKAKAFTFVYEPRNSVGTAQGWKAIVKEYIPDLHEKVTLPESDCIGAIPLCSNSTVNTSANQYDNTGNVNDDTGGCYSGTGSGGSVWYSFTPQANGNIDFMITPTGTTDYDFVLWDITSGCASKTELSCNFSATTGATGLNSSGSSNSQGSSGTTNNSLVAVNTTKTYAICINYYSGTNGGFNLNFQNIAGTVAVTDNTPPTITNAYSTNCASASTFTVNFSEYINCTTLQASDFSLPGYTVSLTTTNCNGGKTNSVVISVSPALVPGTYNMTVNNMNDMCGNPLNQVYVINTTVVPTANAGSDAVACSTPGFFGSTNYGSATLTGSGGSSYLWSTGQGTASITVSPTATTTYTLTAIQGSCASTDQAIVTVAASPTPNLGPDQTICATFPVTMVATGGGTYQWQSTTTTFFGSPTGWANIAGATSATLTITPATTIYYRVLVTNAAGCTGNDVIKITLGAGAFGITAPPFVCNGQAATLSLPPAMTAYTWSVSGVPIGTANTALVVTPLTTTTYTATSTTAGCTGTANVTIPVHSALALTTSANPTTACTGVPVNLTSTGPTSSSLTVTENFEAANGFTLVNGANNKWYWGTAAFATGTKGLYIGTAVTDNNYVIGSFISPKAAINFAYKDYTVSSYCTADFNFKWKCNGQTGQAELRVWLVPTSFIPVAGAAITASTTNILLGGPYFGQTTYQNVSTSLAAYAGQSVRIVFEWKNTGANILGTVVVANPAASIDDIVFTESTTYNYAWSSSPSGFTASTTSATANPTSATTYNLTVTRCDGCPVTSSINVTSCVTLPIELNQFNGKKDVGFNSLFWSTLSEINNDYFTLDRSTNGIDWEKACVQNGAGNSTEEIYYKYEDYEFMRNAINYYKLSQTDFDGSPRNIGEIISIDNRNSNRKVIRLTNILGQEVPMDTKGLLIYIYDDGTIEKVYIN